MPILYVGPLSAHEFWSCEHLVCAVQPFAVRARGVYIRLELRRSVRVYAVSAMRDAQLLTGIRDYLALNISPAILDSANRTTGISYRGLPCAFLDYPAAIHGSYEKPVRIVSRQRGLGKYLLRFLKPRLPLIAQTPYDVGIVQRVLYDALKFTYRGKELAVWHLLVLAAP